MSLKQEGKPRKRKTWDLGNMKPNRRKEEKSRKIVKRNIRKTVVHQMSKAITPG